MPLPRSQFMDTAAYAYDCIPPPPEKLGPPGKQAVISGIDFKDTSGARRYFRKLVKKANDELDKKLL